MHTLWMDELRSLSLKKEAALESGGMEGDTSVPPAKRQHNEQAVAGVGRNYNNNGNVTVSITAIIIVTAMET